MRKNLIYLVAWFLCGGRFEPSFLVSCLLLSALVLGVFHIGGPLDRATEVLGNKGRCMDRFVGVDVLIGYGGVNISHGKIRKG